MFVIIADSRYAKGSKVVMVDRRKNKRTFWSKYLDFAMVYSNRNAAESKADSLKYNSPEVVTLEEAEKVIGRMSTVDFLRVLD